MAESDDEIRSNIEDELCDSDRESKLRQFNRLSQESISGFVWKKPIQLREDLPGLPDDPTDQTAIIVMHRGLV